MRRRLQLVPDAGGLPGLCAALGRRGRVHPAGGGGEALARLRAALARRGAAALLVAQLCAGRAGERASRGGDAAAGNTCADFDARTAAVNDECCDEASEDCSSGRPATCNLGCAQVLLPFFDDCQLSLRPLFDCQLLLLLFDCGQSLSVCQLRFFDCQLP